MECEPSDIARGGDFYYHSTECEPSDIVTGDDFFARLWNVNPLALYFENDVRLFLSQVCSKHAREPATNKAVLLAMTSSQLFHIIYKHA